MQRFILIFGASLICTSSNFVRTDEIGEFNYNNEDTVAIEALNYDVEATTTVVLEDEPNTTEPPPSGRQGRNEREVNYCVTNNGLSGNCIKLKECFPRLFPVNDDLNDTPGGTGVFNQNLAKFLIESSGICGGSNAKRIGALNLLNSRSFQHICCATSNVNPDDFPLDYNDTTTIDAKQTCGTLKIDSKILPEVNKIVGGRKAVLGEFPWMVAMLKRGQQFCGASLIDNRNVLTAAHCVEYMSKGDVAALRLQIGDLDIYSSKETKHVERRAKRVLYHKGFTMKNLEHDIALVHLDKPVEFSTYIQPVCLHPGLPPYDDTGDQEADVMGWGTTSSGGSQSSQLLAVRINVTTQEECNKKYAQAGKKIGPGMVCAGSEGKDSCQGDSGGPLVIGSRSQAQQIGIVSWGIGCASYPGVYTKIDKYKKWISKNKQ